MLHRVKGVGREPVDLLPQFGRRPHREPERQDRDILGAITQGRDQDRNRGQSVVQVLTECPLIGLGGEIAVRGRHDAHVHLDGRGAAHPLKLLLLQHAQQLGLQVESHLRNFVQQQRAAVGALEGALDPLDRAGKGALLVAEEGRLDQALGERGAVELDKRFVTTVALVVNGAGEQLLSGARFTLQQHRGAGRSGHGNRLQDPPNRRRVADDLPFVPELHHFLAERLVFAPQAHELQRLVHGQLKLLRTDRLGDVVDRSGLDAGHRVFDAGVSREHNQRDVVPLTRQQLDKLQPGQPRHSIVGDDQVDAAPLQNEQRFRHAPGAHWGVAGLGERIFENQSDAWLVIDVQNCGHGGATLGRRGRRESACTTHPAKLAAHPEKRDRTRCSGHETGVVAKGLTHQSDTCKGVPAPCCNPSGM